MSVAEDFEKLSKSYKFPFQTLKGKQIAVIQKILDCQDCVAIFPTGYGKTIMYLLPGLLKNQVSLVVSPLRALMDDQVRHFSDMGVKAIAVGPGLSAAERKGLQEAKYQVVLFPPEVLQQLDRWRFFIDSKSYNNNVAVLAIDEAHLLHSWGDNFRPAFNRIAELRSFFTNTPVLLLTATCTAAARSDLIDKVHLSRSVHIEWEVPDRPNIFIDVKSESGMDTSCINWYLDQLKEQGAQTDKAVVYVTGISQMSRLAVDIMAYLGQMAYIGPDRNMVFKMFHSGMERGDLQSILKEYSKPDSSVRLLICTIAFGLGVNIPDIRVIMHWGCCKSLEDYWQEVGRAGRDGLPAMAIMYATKHSLLSVDSTMKNLVVDSLNNCMCIRKIVLDNLSVETLFKEPQQDCNNNCTGKCECAVCKCCTSCKQKCTCIK